MLDQRAFHAERWLYFFIFVHVISWTFIPFLVRYNLPLDAIEGTLWGHQLEWGYDKNPFLNAWLTALATYLGGPSGWMIYFFSQLSVAICFWIVWKLAKNILSPLYALIAVMLLEGIQYYNFHAIDFNDNTLELGLWALCIYFFYQALQSPRYFSWILTGFFAALSMMAKYYTAVLLLSMLLFLFIYPDNRKQLKTLPPYMGLLTFLVILLPHVFWLFSHDFITVKYVLKRTNSLSNWINHLYFPTKFIWQQIEVFLPTLTLFSLLFIGKKPVTEIPFHISTFNKKFLSYLGLGPFLLTALLSMLFRIKLRAGWGMPLMSLWGILLLSVVTPRISKKKITCFLTIIFFMMGISIIAYIQSLLYSSNPSSANFPGQEIAQMITDTWKKTYHRPLSYIAGSRWVSGNIAFYSADHPAVFVEWNKARAPWIKLKDMKRKGAVFVWEISSNETLPENVKNKFPLLTPSTTFIFTFKRNNSHLKPIQIGVAFLPPGTSVTGQRPSLD